MLVTTPPRSYPDLMRMPVELLSAVLSMELPAPAVPLPESMLLSKSTLLMPACVKLPIDSPCPANKRLFVTEIFAAGDVVPAPPTATLSSPSEIHDRVIVKLVAFPGSMPSVLRELVGVMILMSHAVKLLTAPVVDTWKSGELRMVIL